MNTLNIDSDIRNKIIITDDANEKMLREYSDIELAAIYSKNENNFNILKLLLKNKFKKNKKYTVIDKILINTIKCLHLTSSFDAVKLLLTKYAADINCIIRSDAWTPLMYSCVNVDRSNIEIINFLIENGADVNVKHCRYSQPLSLLVKFSSTDEHLEIIKLLINKGCFVDFKNPAGETLLMMCFVYYYNKSIRYKIIKLLLDNKVDVYIKNNDRQNIFDIIKYKIDMDKEYDNSDIYSLIFNYKNLNNDHFCEFDINFIY